MLSTQEESHRFWDNCLFYNKFIGSLAIIIGFEKEKCKKGSVQLPVYHPTLSPASCQVDWKLEKDPKIFFERL